MFRDLLPPSVSTQHPQLYGGRDKQKRTMKVRGRERKQREENGREKRERKKREEGVSTLE